MEEKVKGKKEKLEKMTTSYTNNTNTDVGYSGNVGHTIVEILFLRQVIAQHNLDNKKKMAMI